nr:uncharacterized protein LOC111836565 [Paramormyrops kingsleyae]
MNVSSSLEQNVRLLDKVKAGIHWGSFITTTVFSYMVVTIVHRTPRLRNKLHYVLLCQHCFCISGFNVTGALLHTMLSLHMAMPRIVCWLLFGSQVALARGLMLTLTLMALNICLCVCWPLRYREIVHTVKNKAIMGAWLLALLSPVVFTGMACAEAQEGYLTELDPACHTPMEGWASLLSAAVLLGLLTLLIMLSYVLIYKEGRRVGHFSDANSRGCRTILIHGLQISLHILPGMLIIARLRLGLVGALVVFVVFSLAQSVSPVVYGLRCQEIRTQLPRFFPCWTQRCSKSSNMDMSMDDNGDNSMGINMGNNMGINMGNNMGINMGNNMGINMGNNMGINMGNNMGINMGNNMGINMGNNMGINMGNNMGINMGNNMGINMGNSMGNNLQI